MTIIDSYSPEETEEAGRQLAESVKPGMVIALDGDLGCGKTVFTRGFARGLGIDGPVTSPTFTILQIYEEGRMPLYHFDVYRIAEPEEMDEIGYEEYFFGEGVCLVEWASLIEELLPPDTIHVVIEKMPERGDDYRRIRINAKTGDGSLSLP